MKGTRILPGLAALALAAAPSACREARLESARPPVPVAIDGAAREWAGREAYYNPEEGLKIGFFNDDRYLYVYFATWHRETQARILANGFTGWFDVSGGKKKTFGINYPKARRIPGGGFPGGDEARAGSQGPGMPGDGMPGGGPPAGGGPRGGASARTEMDPAAMGRLLAESRGELGIIVGAKNGRDTLFVPAAVDSAAEAMAAMMGIANRTLVIEVRIPLDRTGTIPYSLAAAPGDLIGVGFEIGEMRRPDWNPTREKPSIDMGGAGGGGMGGGGMGGFGGGGAAPPPGGMGRATQDKFEMWAKVRLAVAP